MSVELKVDPQNRRVKFLTAASGVRAEKNERVTLETGTVYDLVSMTETRPGSIAIAVLDPEVTHPGGKDGAPRPCTIHAQVPADAIQVLDRKADGEAEDDATEADENAPPGPPPRPGLIWHSETHRWRRESEEDDGDPEA